MTCKELSWDLKPGLTHVFRLLSVYCIQTQPQTRVQGGYHHDCDVGSLPINMFQDILCEALGTLNIDEWAREA